MSISRTPPPTPLAEELASSSDATFHHALGRIASEEDTIGSTGVALVVNVIERLQAQRELGDRRQADRVHALLQRLHLDGRALSELAHKARGFSAAVRNVISGLVGPEERRLLVGSHLQHEISAPIVPGRDGSAPTRSPTTTPFTSASGKQLPVDFTAVALLSAPLQEANRLLLQARGFGPIVWTSIEKLEQDLAQSVDICACIVDGSVLQAMDADAQRRLFRLLGTYSTFSWIRVDESQLKLTQAGVRECLSRARYLREGVAAALLSIQPDGKLRDREIADIEAASAALRARHGAAFVPGELSSNQADVLMAAARLHACELHISGCVEVTSLETRFLLGGRSSAKIAILRVNQGGRPVVAKIDLKERVLDEMERFRTFIEPWDDDLRPKLHFHGDAAVLLFGLVPDERNRSLPAEMLEDRLGELWNAQLFGAKACESVEAERDALAEGVESTARRLFELNSRPPPSSSLPSRGNPHVDIFEKLEASGIDWGLSEGAKHALKKAIARFKKHEQSATIHGDVHLRNVLLRADRNPYLIDYAGSGPGHPSVDLVRLELALFLGPVRQIMSEDQCLEYQRALTLDVASYGSLEERFPAFHRCHVNVVCVRGCIAARDYALAIVKKLGGDERDYQATKYLVAWQSLVMMGRHTGLARATIEALAPSVAAW